MRQTTRGKSFTENVLLTLGTKVLLFAVNILTSIITARVLGPHDRGIVSVLLNMATTLDNFCRLGIYSGNIYMIARQKEDISGVAANSIVFSVIFGTIGIIIVIFFKGYILSTFLWNSPPLYLILAICVVPLHLFDTFFTAILQALNKFSVSNTRMILSNLLSLLGLFIALALLNTGVIGTLAVNIVVSFATALFMLCAVKRVSTIKFSICKHLAKRTLSYGIKSYYQTLTSYFHLKLDLYLLPIFLDPSAIAFYIIGTRMAELILILPNTIGTILFPKLSNTRRRHDKLEMMSIVIRQTILSVGLISVLLLIVGESLIVTWYGAEYTKAAEPFKIILPGVMMMALYSVLNRYFMSENKQTINIYSGSIALVGNLTFNIILIPKLGINGAAMASTISYSLATLVLLVFFLKETKCRLRDILSFGNRDYTIYRNIWSSCFNFLELKNR